MTSTREELAAFWNEVLDVDAVAPHASLLDLGGDSLTATMIANRIELAWSFRPSMEQLLTLPFDQVAELCDRRRARDSP